MRTIPRTHTKRIAALRGRLTRCWVLSQENQFIREEVDPAQAWAALDRSTHTTLLDHENDQCWTVRVNASRWYELRP